jgi:hypothetical protein
LYFVNNFSQFANFAVGTSADSAIPTLTDEMIAMAKIETRTFFERFTVPIVAHANRYRTVVPKTGTQPTMVQLAEKISVGGRQTNRRRRATKLTPTRIVKRAKSRMYRTAEPVSGIGPATRDLDCSDTCEVPVSDDADVMALEVV